MRIHDRLTSTMDTDMPLVDDASANGIKENNKAHQFIQNSRDRNAEMNIAYLIFDEIPWHPVIRGQVIELIEKIKPKARIDHYYLISFLPLHRILKNRKRISAIGDELENFGIDLVLIPIPYFPQRFAFAGRWYLLPVVLLVTLPVLLFFVFIKKISLFHCRSYPITTSALIVKKIFGTKFIFDPRSDFPEENITAGRWTETSLSFKMWKLLERLFLKNSDATIAIASTYGEHFRKIFQDSRKRSCTVTLSSRAGSAI